MSLATLAALQRQQGCQRGVCRVEIISGITQPLSLPKQRRTVRALRDLVQQHGGSGAQLFGGPGLDVGHVEDARRDGHEPSSPGTPSAAIR